MSNYFFGQTEPAYLYDDILKVCTESSDRNCPNGLEKTQELVKSLNEKHVDVYAWITGTLSNDGFVGWAATGGACTSNRKTSISGTPHKGKLFSFHGRTKKISYS